MAVKSYFQRKNNATNDVFSKNKLLKLRKDIVWFKIDNKMTKILQFISKVKRLFYFNLRINNVSDINMFDVIRYCIFKHEIYFRHTILAFS